MVIYKVTGSPVLVRQSPSCDARVINVVGPNKLIYTVSEDCGWLRTSAGNYVFKTNDITVDNSPASHQEAIPRITLKNARLTSSDSHYAGEGGEYNGPTIGDDPEVPTNIHSTSSDNIREGSGSAARMDDTVSEITNGKNIVATSPNTKVYYINPWGDREEVSAKDAKILDFNNKSKKLSGPDSEGNVTFMAEDGTIYEVKGTDVKLGSVNSDGSVIINGTTYNEFELAELREQEQIRAEIEDEARLLSQRSNEGYREALNVKDGDIRHIFGMPYQFSPTTDPRPYTDIDKIMDIKAFGRKYKEKISTRAPILVMQPGEAIFLRGYSNSAKGTIARGLVNVAGDKELDKVINGTGGEYYSFKLAKNDYYYTVNSACRAVATFLGLEDVRVPSINAASKDSNSIVGDIFGAASGDTLGSFNWAFNSNFSVASYYAGAVQFYINSESQVQENIGTQTRQSQLASQVNGISDKAMEAMFVMGGIQSSLATNFGIGNKTDIKSATGHLTGEDSSIGNGKGLFNSIVGNITSLLAGGRMYFPEIWADSQFGRSYNVTIKLDSPDCDPLSIYLNILVPLIHIMGFCLPRCAGDNTYISPFLVRAFYKSMFHIDMGMVTSCDIVKGDQGCWTQDGLPTQITVQLSIKDLYSVMTQSMGKSGNTILSNPAQLDYLANLCGINVAPANISRTAELWWMIKGPNRLLDQVVSVPSAMITSLFARVTDFYQTGRWRMNSGR